MAMQNVFNILVDLKVAKTIPQPLVTQNDSVVFILEVMENGVAFDLTDTTTVTLAHTRKDQTVVVTPGTKVGNKATFALGTNETSVTGSVTAKAQFYDADGRVSTLSFSYQVGLDPTGVDYVPSASEATLIEVVLNDGPLIIASAEEAAAYANEQGDYALQVGVDNETRYLNAVETVALRDSTYPTPSHGDTVRVTTPIDGKAKSYRYVLGTGWVVTDVYNSTAIDQVNQQLAEKSKYLKESEYNMENGLKNWRLAFGRAHSYSGRTDSKIPSILVVGDSITADANASDRNSGYVNLLRNSMQIATGVQGKGFVGYDIFVSKTGWTYQLKGTNRMTWVGTPSSAKISFSETFSSMDVIYSTQPDGVTATIKIDGSTRTFNCNGAESYHNVYRALSAATDGLHTVDIEIPTGNVYIEGFVFHAQQHGVFVHKLGHPGIRALNYKDNPSMIKATIQDFNPDLTIIALGANDCAGQETLNNYKEALRQLATSAKISGDVLFMSTPPREDSSYAIKYHHYVSAMRDIAKEMDVAHIDFHSKWGGDYQKAFNNGYIADSVHPTQPGHNNMAEELRKILGGMPFNGLINISTSNPAYGRIGIKKNLYPIDIKLGQRGNDVAVTEGATTHSVSLPDILSSTTMPYSVSITPNWNTTYWVTSKGYGSFVVNFGTVAPTGAKIDWSILRN